MKFYPWLIKRDKDFARLEEFPLEIQEDSYLLNKGLPAKDWFPNKIEFEIAPNSGMRLPDVLPNTLFLLVISEKLKEILVKNSTSNFEFLNIKIRNHKKRLVKKEYFLANCLEKIFCVDREKSDFIISALDKNQINYFKHLYLDINKTPKEKDIFRLGEKSTLIMIRDDLAEKIKNTNCTGLNFTDIENYGRQYRTPDRSKIIEQLMKKKNREKFTIKTLESNNRLNTDEGTLCQ